MDIQVIELRKISAGIGKVLTNGEIYSKEIYLGVTDKAENWREITEEEYAEILAKQEDIE
jgi:hypothetical protein